MGIFDILFRNSGARARTLRPANQSLPQGFRGLLLHDVSLCIGCGTCAYVCSPGAIKLQQGADGFAWQYQGRSCTFCARCAEYCPTGAIQMEKSTRSGIVGQADSLDTHHVIEMQPCKRCGTPFVPLPAPILARLTGREVEGGVKELMRLCEKCRSRVTSQRWKDSLTGNLKGIKG